MTPERWRRMGELFEAALEEPAAERPGFVERACGSDAALRDEVLALLASHEVASGFLSGGTEETQAGPPGGRLAPGTRLGRYELLSLLGAGGMGEVYRARDDGLGRDVAVKVLPSAAVDAERLRRFELEARAAGQLNHPNVLAVYDAGQHEGRPYIVTELLSGRTLRERLGDGPLSPPKAAQYAGQIAHGLAAIHGRGVVHRDLKPENVSISPEGHVKILDFGLARVLAREGGPAPVASAHTTPGMLLGTLAYMAPEQARGEAADPRADVFALGAILFEMLTGRPAFRRGSPAETLHAVLREDPAAELHALASVPPTLARVVQHCLEKERGERFQSADDLAFALEASVGSVPLGAAPAETSRPRRAWRWPLALALVIAAAALSLRAMARAPAAAPPAYRQLTFRRGTVQAARFSPDGNSVYYSAAWDGSPPAVFSMRLDGLESRPVGLGDAELVAVAPGEMAILRPGAGGTRLSRAPLEGGTPRDVMEGLSAADWSPDGRTLAVVRSGGGRTHLEFPAGRNVYETAGTLINPRVSPDGRRVALLDRPMLGNSLGSVVVVDIDGRAQRLSDGWLVVGGVAWARGGSEVWFSAARTGNSRSVNAVSLGGRERLVGRGPSSFVVQDVAADGRALVTHEHERSEAWGRLAGEGEQREHSFYDWTHATDFLPDGRGLVFTAEGEGGGPLYTAYLWRRPEEPPVRLGEGHTTEISPDGTAVLAMVRSTPPRLVVLPTGAGEVRTLVHGRTFAEHHWAWWLPDGHILFLANVAGHAPQLFVQALDEAVAHPIAPEGVTAYRHKAVSPDGRHVLVLLPGPPPRYVLWPLDGGPPRELPSLTERDRPLQWSADGASVFVRAAGPVLPVHIDRVDLASGRRTTLMVLRPADAAGVVNVGDVLFTRDGQAYVFNCHRDLSELFLVEGLR